MKWLFAVSLLAGCATGDDLHLPLTPMSPDERVATFNAWRGLTEVTKYVEACNRRGVCDEVAIQAFPLNNGIEITDPSQLLPLVAPTSDAATHIRIREHHSKVAAVWAAAALVSFFGGGALATAGIVEDHDDHRSGLGVAMISVGSVIAIGGLVTGLSVVHHEAVLNDAELAKIITTYDAGLAQKLNVCVTGLAVKPCD